MFLLLHLQCNRTYPPNFIVGSYKFNEMLFWSVHWCLHWTIFQRKFVWLFVEVACLNTSTFSFSAIEYSPELKEKSMQIPRAIKCEVDSPKQKKISALHSFVEITLRMVLLGSIMCPVLPEKMVWQSGVWDSVPFFSLPFFKLKGKTKPRNESSFAAVRRNITAEV